MASQEKVWDLSAGVLLGSVFGTPVRGEGKRTEQEKVTGNELATETSVNRLRNCGAKNDT